MTVDAIRQRAAERGVTRLCHITRSMTLPFIIERGEIVATSRLDEDQLAIYYPNDDLRLDGHKTHVACSIQYPNSWYLRSVHAREPLFKDWIVLLLEPDPLWWEGTLFCPVNAATERGRYIEGSVDGFDAMFDTFTPTGRIGRGLTHLDSCPTDNQAEVLVPDGIRLDLVRCVVVRDESQAMRERWRIREFGLMAPELPLAVCPVLFDPQVLAGRIASGVETNPDCGPI